MTSTAPMVSATLTATDKLLWGCAPDQHQHPPLLDRGDVLLGLEGGGLHSPRGSEGILLEELRCGYSSKRCDNIRTTKKGGGLHRFCEFHRRRANKNQWRVDNKRRMLRSQLKDARAAAAIKTSPVSSFRSATPRKAKAAASPTMASLIKTEPLEACTVQGLATSISGPSTSAGPPALSDGDLAMLTSILFDDEAETWSEAVYVPAPPPVVSTFILQPVVATTTSHEPPMLFQWIV